MEGSRTSALAEMNNTENTTARTLIFFMILDLQHQFTAFTRIHDEISRKNIPFFKDDDRSEKKTKNMNKQY
jgi:hypothetical protein